MAVAEGQTELFEQSEKSEGPSRPASCDTARPGRRAGKPQKNIIYKVKDFILLDQHTFKFSLCKQLL
nr:hypothetical protein [Saprospira grandis]